MTEIPRTNSAVGGTKQTVETAEGKQSQLSSDELALKRSVREAVQYAVSEMKDINNKRFALLFLHLVKQRLGGGKTKHIDLATHTGWQLYGREAVKELLPDLFKGDADEAKIIRELKLETVPPRDQGTKLAAND